MRRAPRHMAARRLLPESRWPSGERAARTERLWLRQRGSGLRLDRRSALPAVRSAGARQRYCLAGGGKPDLGRCRRHCAMGDRRHDQRVGRRSADPHPRQAVRARASHQSRDHDRSPGLSADASKTHAGPAMAEVSWTYPQDELLALARSREAAVAAAPVAEGVAVDRLNFGYAIEGARAALAAIRAFDDGSQVFIEFPETVTAGEIPPSFVLGSSGKAELVISPAGPLLCRRPLVFRGRAAPGRKAPAGRPDRPDRTGRPQPGEGLVTGPGDQGSLSPLPKEDPQALVLRGRPRRVVRFRRGLLVGAAGGLCAAIAGLTWVALEPNRPRPRGAGQFRQAVHPAAGGRACRRSGSLQRGSQGSDRRFRATSGGRSLEQQRSTAAAAEAEEAGAEPSLAAAAQIAGAVNGSEAGRGAGCAQLGTAGAALGQGSECSSGDVPAPPPAGGGGTARRRRLGRSAAAQDRFRATGRGRPRPACCIASFRRPRWMLSAGTIIPASLVTGLNSDLPGLVLAQVTENVRDSGTGRTVLIPQGARHRPFTTAPSLTGRDVRCWSGSGSSSRTARRSSWARCRRPTRRAIQASAAG